MIYIEEKQIKEIEIKRLKKLSRKTRDARMRTRYDAIRLRLEGRSYNEIAEILNITHYTVRNYEKAYKEFGEGGLIIKASERDLRVIKTKSKVSGCFRTLTGGRRFANLMSITKTAIKQNLSPYKSVKAIFES